MSTDQMMLREVILSAVDKLRSKNIKPDDVTIADFIVMSSESDEVKKMISPDLTRESILKELSVSVEQKDLLKLKLRDGSHSYIRTDLSQGSQAEMRSKTTDMSESEKSQQILSTVEKLSSDPDSIGSTDGVSVQMVIKHLHTNFQLLDCDRDSIQKLLVVETQLGTCVQLENGNFMLTPVANGSNGEGNTHMSVERGKKRHPKSPESERSGSSGSTRSGETRPTDETLPMTRGRPISTRKKIKKSLGPDFLDPSELGYGYLKNAYDPKCSICHETVPRRDDLLNCSKCDFSGHAKCIKRNHPVVSTVPSSKWLCPTCIPKCASCSQGYTDPKNPFLTCTVCDTVYHIKCLGPEDATRASNGKCKECLEEDRHASHQMVIEPQVVRIDENEDSLPKPDFFNGLLRKELEATVRSELPSTNGSVTSDASGDSKSCLEDKKNSSLAALRLRDPKNWSVDDVWEYINSFGYEAEASVFKDQEIDGKSLLLLRRDDVLTGLGLKLGPALKIYALITHLQKYIIVSPDNHPVIQ